MPKHISQTKDNVKYHSPNQFLLKRRFLLVALSSVCIRQIVLKKTVFVGEGCELITVNYELKIINKIE